MKVYNDFVSNVELQSHLDWTFAAHDSYKQVYGALYVMLHAAV